MIGRLARGRWLHELSFLIVPLLLSVVIYGRLRHPPATVEIVMQASSGETTQVFFDTGSGFSEQESVRLELSPGVQAYRFAVPRGDFKFLRFDPMNAPGSFSIRHLKLENWFDSYTAAPADIVRLRVRSQQARSRIEEGLLQGMSLGSDPYLVLAKPPFATTAPRMLVLPLLAAIAVSTAVAMRLLAPRVEYFSCCALLVAALVSLAGFGATSGAAAQRELRLHAALLSQVLARPAPQRDRYFNSRILPAEFSGIVDVINAQTPPDAFILVPPQAVPWLCVGNAAYTRHFVYPRRLENGTLEHARRSFLENGTDIRGRFAGDVGRQPDFIVFVRNDGGVAQPDRLWPETDVDADFVLAYDQEKGDIVKLAGPYDYERFRAEPRLRFGLIRPR